MRSDMLLTPNATRDLQPSRHATKGVMGGEGVSKGDIIFWEPRELPPLTVAATRAPCG